LNFPPEKPTYQFLYCNKNSLEKLYALKKTSKSILEAKFHTSFSLPFCNKTLNSKTLVSKLMEAKLKLYQTDWEAIIRYEKHKLAIC
jgi:hypothetical protein